VILLDEQSMLDDRINEAFLFHGTSKKALDNIVKNGKIDWHFTSNINALAFVSFAVAVLSRFRA
jgi:hypothetical protein